jgi:hypothetical protein
VLLPQLRRVRWAVRATLVLGVAASVVANVLHALDNPISQAIAAWPPCALLLTVELISRVPVHRRSLAFARLLATATIAGIAAWVSYWHMAGVAARYGETGASPYLLPLSVDGLIVVASICLVELGGRITSLEAEARATSLARETAQAAQVATPAQPPPAMPRPIVSPTPQPAAATLPAPAPRPAEVEPAVPGLIPVPTSAKPARRSTADALAEVAAALTQAEHDAAAFTPTMTRQARTAGPARKTPPAKQPAAIRPPTTSRSSTSGAAKARRTPAETVAAAAKIKAERPDVTETQLAAELGISASRWRTIRREAGVQGDGLRLAA